MEAVALIGPKQSPLHPYRVPFYPCSQPGAALRLPRAIELRRFAARPPGVGDRDHQRKYADTDGNLRHVEVVFPGVKRRPQVMTRLSQAIE